MPMANAFDDIATYSEKAAAESLASLGIVDNVANFNPNRSLTRAEFCKIAVLAAGFDEVSLYSGYTIYPDVAANTWYAPYVNAAVRKYGIIKGDEKGMFNPNSSITFGEATTILIRMLGYETKDVGLMWPTDYINKAQSIGLSNGVNKYGAAEAISRGQAAILLCNMLLTDTKGGTVFASTAYATGSEETILVSTSQTNPTLDSNRAELYYDDAIKTYHTAGTISSYLCGLKGLPVFTTLGQSRLKGFIADVGAGELLEVSSVSATQISTTTGKISVPRDTKTLAGGTVASYITNWFDIKSGDSIVLYFSEGGELDFISVRNITVAISGSNTFVYGYDRDSLPSGATYMKNGAAIKASDVKNYDVVSYSSANNTYYVSSDRVTLLFQSASPVYSNPSVIKAGNRDFNINEQAGGYFGQSGIKLGSKVTLLLDYNGNIAAAMPTSKVSAKAVGVMTSLSSSKVSVDLLCGISLSGTPSFKGYSNVAYNRGSVSSAYKLEGQLVEISQNSNGIFEFSEVKYSSLSGDLNIEKGTLGKYKLAPNAAVYECSYKGMGLTKITLDDIPVNTVDASKVLHTETDPSGDINMIVLEDVTGDRFVYGMLAISKGSESVTEGELSTTITAYALALQTADSLELYVTRFAPTNGMTNTSSAVPAAVAADLVGDTARSYNFSTPVNTLKRAATVSRTDFEAYRGVKIAKNTYAEISPDVVIYSSATSSFLSSLSEARANYTEFEIYLDRPVAEGGVVRVIVAK